MPSATPPTSNCVCVIFNGYVIVPSPIITISRSFDEDGVGRTIGAKVNIKLDGKIVTAIAAGPNGQIVTRQQAYNELIASNPCLQGELDQNNGIGISATGTYNLMQEEKAFRRVFTNTNNLNLDGDFITSSTAVPYPVYEGSSEPNRLIIKANGIKMFDGYAKVVSYDANPTPNNWTSTIEYSVSLESDVAVEQFIGDQTRYLLKSVTDDISIEPIEETNLFNPEDGFFGQYFGTSATNLVSTTNPIWWAASYPAFATRYRISRTVEAVGKHSWNQMQTSTEIAADDPANTNNVASTVLNNQFRRPRLDINKAGTNSAYVNARAYVLDRLKHYPTQYFLYNWTIVNRVRSLAPNEMNGSFRLTETSIAVNPAYHPAWADDWTAEVSVDNTFLQTVRINGTIKGFETYTADAKNDQNTYQYGVRQATFNDTVSHSGMIQPIVATPSIGPGFTNVGTPGYNIADPAIYVGGNMVGKYQNAIRGLSWLKGFVNANNVTVPQNSPYYSPIVNRARIFFNSNTLGNNFNNPYVFLNNQNIINERLRLQNITPSAWNNPAPLSIDKMNPIPINMTESHRMHAGEIDYTFEFNNRPLNLVNGSVSENLSVSDTFPTQQIAEIFVLGRRLGPVLQDLGTVTSSTREVTFEIALPRPPTLAARLVFPVEAFKAATGIVEQMNPKYMFGVANNTYIKSYVKTDNQSWNPMEGKLTITKSWLWQRAR